MFGTYIGVLSDAARSEIFLQTGAWEKIWHLLIPPMMTLLDDFEVRWKLAGLSLVQDVIEGAPPVLLTRTGVDGLLYQARSISTTRLRC
jgi:hypothetical protein